MRRAHRFALALASTLLVGSVAVAGAATTTTPTFGGGTTTFTTFAAPDRLPDPLTGFDNTNLAGEPSIGVDWKTGALMYQAFTSTYKVHLGGNASTPTATWTNVTPTNSVVNGDPILFTDSVTGRTFAGGLAESCSVLSYTDDDGTSWIPMTNACSGTYDHETIGAGPWAGAQPLTATYPHAVYYCAQGADLNACATSSTGGLAFGAPSASMTIGQVRGGGGAFPYWCLGLHGHVKVSADGTTYLPSNHCWDLAGSATLLVGGSISRDNGQTWKVYNIAGAAAPSGFDPSVATTPDNTVYEAWERAGDHHPMVAWSRNHGTSWTSVDLTTKGSPVQVGTFQTTVAGDNGRVTVAYLGSTTAGNPFDASWHGVWNLYVSTTYDAGKTWTTTLASTDPVQRGWMCNSGVTCLTGRNLLDFMDASVTQDGRVVVGYADGCIASTGCAAGNGTEAESTSQYATIAVQQSGRGLFSRYDVATASAPTTSGAQRR